MTDLPILEAALKLADQDSPLPSLAGPALKRLRQEINHYKGAAIHEDAVQDALLKIMRLLGIVGGTPSEIAREVEKRLTAKANEVARLSYPVKESDSATLTALITELRMREVVGRAKYGTDVDRTDLTNGQWRQHLREELMDALLYSLAEERTATPIWMGIDFAAAADHGCWCETCRPIRLTDMRMVLCPTCSNKRCPHAHDHRNACTGSNAVGQPSSSWGASNR